MSHARRFGRLLILFGAASTGTLLAAGPAAAASVVPLHDAHRNTTAAGFSTHSCAQIPGNKPTAGADGWVFVLPKNDADFVTLTLQYRTTGGTTTTVTIPDAGDPYPDGFATNGASKAWVVLPAGWTLLDGSAVVSADTKATFFNLTHTCPGGSTPTGSPSTSPSGSPTKSPTKSPSGEPSHSASPSDSVSPSESGTATATPTSSPSTPGSVGGGSGGLPQTGSPIYPMLVAGASAVTGGAVLLLLSLRRRRVATQDA